MALPPSVRISFLYALAAALAGAGPQMPGAQATLVRDIGKAIAITTENSFVLTEMVSVGDVVYFQQDDGIHGRELWRSDGTALGTSLVRDLCPGSCGGPSIFAFETIAATADRVLFVTDDGVHGTELWSLTGPADSPVLVRDFRPGEASGQPRLLASTGSRVFLLADDGVHGRELWVSDGTPAGTIFVADLEPGAGGISIGPAVALGNDLLFGGGPQNLGGLWRSDGTPQGTTRLSAVATPPQNWSVNAPFVLLGGRLIFDGVGPGAPSWRPTIWTSDGTSAGTHEVAPLESRGFYILADSYVGFFSGNEIWRTDGTSAGTAPIPLPPGADPFSILGMGGALGDQIFFPAFDSAHGLEVWSSDGVTAGILRDVRPGAPSGIEFGSDHVFLGTGPFLASIGSRIVFMANDGVNGNELWGSDGTSGGTSLLFDARPGPASSQVDLRQQHLAPGLSTNGLLYRLRSALGGSELWRTDGFAAGTSRLAMVDRQTSAFLPSRPQLSLYANRRPEDCLAPLADGLLFAADDGELGREPWFTAGTAGSTYLVADVATGAVGSSPFLCQPVGSASVFHGTHADGVPALFATDGSAGDLELLADPFELMVFNRPAAVFDDALYLIGNGGLWRTDGSAAGTEAIEPFLQLSMETLVARSSDLVLSGLGLMLSDGTPGGSTILSDPSFDELQASISVTPLGASFVFLGWTPATGQELWFSDGTPEGTVLLRDICPGPCSGFPEEIISPARAYLTRIVEIDSRLVFAAEDGVHGAELWVTDGTPAGTTLLADLVPGSYPSSPRELTRAGDWVFFVAETPGAGRELWRTNGLPGGTQLVVDLVVGPDSSLPQELTAAGSELYFSAWTPATGREPWRLRASTSAGAALERLADIAPGPLSSSPLAFLDVGGKVFFPANDNSLGFELWSVQEPDSIFSDGFESSGTVVWSVSAL